MNSTFVYLIFLFYSQLTTLRKWKVSSEFNIRISLNPSDETIKKREKSDFFVLLTSTIHSKKFFRWFNKIWKIHLIYFYSTDRTYLKYKFFCCNLVHIYRDVNYLLCRRKIEFPIFYISCMAKYMWMLIEKLWAIFGYLLLYRIKFLQFASLQKNCKSKRIILLFQIVIFNKLIYLKYKIKILKRLKIILF